MSDSIRDDVVAIRDALDRALRCTCPDDDDDGKHVDSCPYCKPACALGRLADDVMPNQYRELRDRFAMAAMPLVSLKTTGAPSEEAKAAEIARLSYLLADAMLAARGGK